MRVKLVFELENEIILLDYRRKFISFFKSSLERESKEAKEKFFGKSNSKDYTFSTYFNGKFTNTGIEIKNKRIILNFSCYKMSDGIYFTNAFIGSVHKSFEFGENNKITLKKLEMVKEKQLRSLECEFRILSPIIVKERDNKAIKDKRKNKDKYYYFMDEKWIEALKTNLKFQLKDKFDYSVDNEIDELEIIAQEPYTKKTVVENYGIKFPVTIGNIYIRGTQNLIDYFMKAGIGSKRSSGFGMIELV